MDCICVSNTVPTQTSVPEFQRKLKDPFVEVDDTLTNADDIDHNYSLLCQCVKKSDECLPRVK